MVFRPPWPGRTVPGPQNRSGHTMEGSSSFALTFRHLDNQALEPDGISLFPRPEGEVIRGGVDEDSPRPADDHSATLTPALNVQAKASHHRNEQRARPGFWAAVRSFVESASHFLAALTIARMATLIASGDPGQAATIRFGSGNNLTSVGRLPSPPRCVQGIGALVVSPAKALNTLNPPRTPLYRSLCGGTVRHPRH
jgi:hypothetical protein